jgi:MFS family permease
VANIAGAPLAAGLLMLDGKGGWAGWRWLFLVEGIPSVATGIAMLYVLPKDFSAAKFLGAQDKAWLTQVIFDRPRSHLLWRVTVRFRVCSSLQQAYWEQLVSCRGIAQAVL